MIDAIKNEYDHEVLKYLKLILCGKMGPVMLKGGYICCQVLSFNRFVADPSDHVYIAIRKNDSPEGEVVSGFNNIIKWLKSQSYYNDFVSICEEKILNGI